MTTILKTKAAMGGDNGRPQESIPSDKGARSLTLMGQYRPELSPEGDRARCERCQEFTVVVTRIPPSSWRKEEKVFVGRICDECRAALEAEEEQRKIAWRRANIKNLLSNAGVPKRFLPCTLQNFEGYGRLKVRERPTLITGPIGVGKTHLAVGYLGEALEQHGDRHGLFLEAPKLFLDLRDTFSRNTPLDESGVLAPYLKVPFLVLDDLGAEKLSDYVRQTLYLLINKRYGDCQDTIITSNLSLDEIGQNYGDRLASRIAGMGPELSLMGADRRLG